MSAICTEQKGPWLILTLVIATACGTKTPPSSASDDDPGWAANAEQASVVCGDGIREGGEVCEETDFGGKTCADFGFASGDLSCVDDCGRIDDSSCGCVSAGCEAGERCEVESRTCLPGCDDSDEDCDVNEVCDQQTNQCVCDSGFHDCSGTCRADDDPNNCGASCTTCPAQSGEIAMCIDDQCEIACDDDYRMCAGACRACPLSAATVTCQEQLCVAASCDDGERLCNAECSVCPSEHVSETTCVANECVALSCDDGYEQCGGTCAPCPTEGVIDVSCQGQQCVASQCMDGHLSCEGECASCPSSSGIEAVGCVEASCQAIECDDGFYLCDAGCCLLDSEAVYDDDVGTLSRPVIDVADDGEVFFAAQRYVSQPSFDARVVMGRRPQALSDFSIHEIGHSYDDHRHFLGASRMHRNGRPLFYLRADAVVAAADDFFGVASWESEASVVGPNIHHICGKYCDNFLVQAGAEQDTGTQLFYFVRETFPMSNVEDKFYFRVGIQPDGDVDDIMTELSHATQLQEAPFPRAGLSNEGTVKFFWGSTSDSTGSIGELVPLNTFPYVDVEVSSADFGGLTFAGSMSPTKPLDDGFEFYTIADDLRLFYVSIIGQTVDVTEQDIPFEVGAIYSYQRIGADGALLCVNEWQGVGQLGDSRVLYKDPDDGVWRTLARIAGEASASLTNNNDVVVVYIDPAEQPPRIRYATFPLPQ